MSRSLNSYCLPPHIRYKLINCGYTDVDDIQNSTVEELCHEVGLLQEEALDVLKIIISADENEPKTSKKCSESSFTAFSLLQCENQFLTTFCYKLDEILGGGIPLMKLTEICGAPGIGKTQMGLTLCINVQLPKTLGGVDGEAILIDTEGSFIVERLIDIATAAAEHIDVAFSKGHNAESMNFKNKYTIDNMLKRVHIYRCRDHTELLAVITILPEFLKEHPKVRVIVIDSIAFHFRYGFDRKYGLRTRILCGLAQSLLRIASEHNLAVDDSPEEFIVLAVCLCLLCPIKSTKDFGIIILMTEISEFRIQVVLMNQMTTKISNNSDSYLIPSLGESWGHACTIRIVLFWEENLRKALLFKSPWSKEAVATFEITTAGIRDFSPNTSKPEHKRSFSPTLTTSQPKKPKCTT